MNYIGSKYKLSDFIKSAITDVVGDDLEDKVFCDLFAGTGIVGRTFKTCVKEVIANDLEYYSYVLNQNYIGNHQKISPDNYITYLNELSNKKGFVFTNYCLGGAYNRQYFSDENGLRIDSIRMQIEDWKKSNEISDPMYYFLLASLLESADKVANTASVYASYLKKLKKTAQKKLIITPATFQITNNAHRVYNENSNGLIKRIEGDILYLDPPYNARQYGANYHMLNTIAKYNTFVPAGKTGLPRYDRSDYCRRRKAMKAFEELIRNAKFKFVFLSYNNEGLMPADEIQAIMKRYGKYDLNTTMYRRFKADNNQNRRHKASETIEYLHILEK